MLNVSKCPKGRKACELTFWKLQNFTIVHILNYKITKVLETLKAHSKYQKFKFLNSLGEKCQI